MRRAIWVIIAIVAVGSFSSLLSPLFWGFDLINHLRLQALVVSVVVAIIAACWGRGILLAGLGVVVGNAILFALPLVQAMNNPSAAVTSDRAVRILAINVWSQNRQHDRVLDLVAETAPDIVLLTETNLRWDAELSPLEKAYPYVLHQPDRGNFGMAVYSKLPFRGQMVLNPEIVIRMGVLTFEGFTIINAHPVPPMAGHLWAANKAYLEELSRQVEALDHPVIVAGDLNTTIWGDNMGPLLDAGLRPLGGWGAGYTWPVGNPLLRMQIDHILIRGAKAVEFRVLPDIGSDHFPIIADVRLQ